MNIHRSAPLLRLGDPGQVTAGRDHDRCHRYSGARMNFRDKVCLSAIVGRGERRDAPIAWVAVEDDKRLSSLTGAFGVTGPEESD